MPGIKHPALLVCLKSGIVDDKSGSGFEKGIIRFKNGKKVVPERIIRKNCL